MKNLTDAHINVVTEVLNSYVMHTIRTLQDDPGSIPASERDVLRNILADELVATGLDSSDEPNARGIIIEDVINHLRTE